MYILDHMVWTSQSKFNDCTITEILLAPLIDIGDGSAICNACNGVRNQDPRSIKGISNVQITF